MRLILLAAIICTGICTLYAKLERQAQPQTWAYDGPATFVSVANRGDPGDGPGAHWILICGVNGRPVAFSDRDGRLGEMASGLTPGQRVHLVYTLPVGSANSSIELGPPTIQLIAPQGRTSPSAGTLVALQMQH